MMKVLMTLLKVRGKIINCLGKVSDNLHDSDQLSKTAKVMSDVTAKKDEVTSSAKVATFQ